MVKSITTCDQCGFPITEGTPRFGLIKSTPAKSATETNRRSLLISFYPGDESSEYDSGRIDACGPSCLYTMVANWADKLVQADKNGKKDSIPAKIDEPKAVLHIGSMIVTAEEF